MFECTNVKLNRNLRLHVDCVLLRMKTFFVGQDHTDLQQTLGPCPEVLAGHSRVKRLAFRLPEPLQVLLHACIYLFQGFRSWTLRVQHTAT